MTYKINWVKIVNENVLNGLKKIGNLHSNDSVTELKGVIIKILDSCGGFPFIETDTYDSEVMVQKVLHSSIKHTLSEIIKQKPIKSKYYLVDAKSNYIEQEVAVVIPFNLNSASRPLLKRHLNINNKLITEIIDNRNQNGPYKNLQDLIKRVKGIGEKLGSKLGPNIEFDSNKNLILNQFTITNNFNEDLTTLLNLQSVKKPKDKLIAGFKLVLNSCQKDKNPYNYYFINRKFAEKRLPSQQDVEFIGNLFGTEYYSYLGEAFASAKKSINVAIFHIALGNKKHPTHILIDHLIKKHKEGIAIRVFMDKDRDIDPYLSTIINSKAKKYLEAAGIEVKFDSSEKLFHSKFITIDNDISIIGSHNWSTGSFFNTDDLSVIIKSKSFNKILRERFERLYG